MMKAGRSIGKRPTKKPRRATIVTLRGGEKKRSSRPAECVRFHRPQDRVYGRGPAPVKGIRADFRRHHPASPATPPQTSKTWAGSGTGVNDNNRSLPLIITLGGAAKVSNVPVTLKRSVTVPLRPPAKPLPNVPIVYVTA